MKNLEQLRQLQKLLEDGVSSQEEFDSQESIQSLNSLVWNSDPESELNFVCWLIVISLFFFNTSYFVCIIWSTLIIKLLILIIIMLTNKFN